MEFKRKNIRLQRACYIGRRWYFLTACTQDRIPWLRDARLVDEQLRLLTDTAGQEVFDLQLGVRKKPTVNYPARRDELTVAATTRARRYTKAITKSSFRCPWRSN